MLALAIFALGACGLTADLSGLEGGGDDASAPTSGSDDASVPADARANGDAAAGGKISFTGPIHPEAAPGLCLDVVEKGTANGTLVQVWTCTGNPNQEWTYDGTLLRVYGNKCLDVTGGSVDDGTPIEIWDCSAEDGNQAWTWIDGAFQWTGQQRCLDLTDGVDAPGTALQLWTCQSGDPNQEWSEGTTMEGGAAPGSDAD
jgi:hypothetical protein